MPPLLLLLLLLLLPPLSCTPPVGLRLKIWASPFPRPYTSYCTQSSSRQEFSISLYSSLRRPNVWRCVAMVTRTKNGAQSPRCGGIVAGSLNSLCSLKSHRVGEPLINSTEGRDTHVRCVWGSPYYSSSSIDLSIIPYFSVSIIFGFRAVTEPYSSRFAEPTRGKLTFRCFGVYGISRSARPQEKSKAGVRGCR